MQRLPPRASEDPTVLTAQLLLPIGFGILAIAAPTSAAFSGRALFILLPFGAGLILIAGGLSHPRQGVRRVIAALLSPMGLAALVLAAWAALSLLWTPFLHEAGQRLFKVTSTLALATVV